MATIPSHTQFAAFSSSAAFSFRPGNASLEAEQFGKAKETYYTSSSAFLNNVLLKDPARFNTKQSIVTLKCLPLDRWGDTNFEKKRILFILPSNALGNNVAATLFISAFQERWSPRRVGVCCTQSSTDFFLRLDNIDICALWVSKKAVQKYHYVIDLGHLESRKNIAFNPVDMEGELLHAFSLSPSIKFPSEPRALRPKERMRVGIFPLASSPLRTLPIALTEKLVSAFKRFSDVTVSLNKFQHQGQLYRQNLSNSTVESAIIIEAFESIGDLVGAIEQFDYAVFADSGPAHIAKLTGTPGSAVYTSASGDVLQGRFKNLVNWTVQFSSPYCTAPCGLAKLRQTENGRIGCMGSLGVTVDALPNTPKSTNPAIVEKFLLNDPIPCVAATIDQFDSLWKAIADDIADKQTR